MPTPASPVCTRPRTTRARLREVVDAIAAISGFFTRRFNSTRSLATGFNVLVGVAVYASGYRPPVPVILAVFVALFVGRYLFLFYSFGSHGVAAFLRCRLGDERGFGVYEGLTALSFFVRGVSFGWLLDADPLGRLALPSESLAGIPLPSVLFLIGVLLASVGMIINVWATLVVGIGTYYYRDLFLQRLGEFKVEGPYRFLRNPMYGLGQCAGFGAALMALSPAGLLATALNQGMMYLFNGLVEQPHVRRHLVDATTQKLSSGLA